MTTRSDLDALNRDGLIERARRVGVSRPEVMTRVEMIDEIIRRQETDVAARRRARGWLGVARDLVASLIEQGLNMPDAAELVRQGVTPTRVQHQPPVATVTLAEIYAAQGHLKRALGMLDQVLETEPDHAAARSLRDRLTVARPVAVRATEPEQPEDAPPAPEVEAPAAELASESSADVAPAPPLPAPVEVSPVPPPRVAAPAVEAPPVEVPPAPPPPVAAPAVEAPPVAPAPPFAAPPREDQLFAIPNAGGGVWLHWELSERTRARVPQHGWVVRLCALWPRVSGARRAAHDVVVGSPSGSLLVPGFGSGAVVRAALGQPRGQEFVPHLVAAVLDADGVAFAAAEVDGQAMARARAAALGA
ncbi:MAG: tetratricopeptide repeat protein [Polyangiaceae bacterium]|nr:tetratricopeptide repeat protein [Polyangiaceae bacterium]